MVWEISKKNINNFVMADQKRTKAYGLIQISADSFFEFWSPLPPSEMGMTLWPDIPPSNSQPPPNIFVVPHLENFFSKWKAFERPSKENWKQDSDIDIKSP